MYEIHTQSQYIIMYTFRFFKKYFIYLFRLCWVLVSTQGCGIWNLVPRPGIELRSPALGARSVTNCTTGEFPYF